MGSDTSDCSFPFQPIFQIHQLELLSHRYFGAQNNERAVSTHIECESSFLEGPRVFGLSTDDERYV